MLIERTSKKWKGLKVISFVVMFVVATIFYANNNQVWIPIFIIGVILYITARLGAWWNHG